MSLVLINENNQLNVDSHYNNLALYKKINKSQMQKIETRFNVPTKNMRISYNEFRNIPKTQAYGYRIEIPNEIQNPIAAISLFRDSAFSGGIYTGTDRKKYLSIYTAFSDDFDVYLFSTNKLNHKNYGLEIYNENKQKVFDSENKYLRIIPSIDNNKKCALILHGAVIAEETLRGTGTNFVRFLWSFIVESNTIKDVKYYQSNFYKHYNFRRDALPKPKYNNKPLIVDVTNY